MGLANLYHKRLVREPRPCCMCSKDTPVCLSNAAGAATDFLYCCESHLADFNVRARANSLDSPTSPLTRLSLPRRRRPRQVRRPSPRRRVSSVCRLPRD